MRRIFGPKAMRMGNEVLGASKKKKKALNQCDGPTSSLFEFPVKGQLPRVSRLYDDKGNNKIILGAVHRSPGIYLIAYGNPETLSQEMCYEGCATSHRLKRGPLTPKKLVSKRGIGLIRLMVGIFGGLENMALDLPVPQAINQDFDINFCINSQKGKRLLQKLCHIDMQCALSERTHTTSSVNT